jgi:HEAT repeat protein
VIAFLQMSGAVMGALSVVFVVALAARRAWLLQAAAVRAAADDRLSPLALEIISGESRPRLPATDTQALGRVLSRYSRELAGEGSSAIAAFFEDSGGVDRELTALTHRRVWRRATAAFALGDMAAPRAVPALLLALGDPDRSVRAAAARSLGRLSAPEGVAPLLRALVLREVPHVTAAHALIAIGAAALPGLTELSGDADPEIRANAIELIGLLADASEGPGLGRHLRDPAAEVRAKAAGALGRLGAAEATEQLCSALGDPVAFVRVAVARALGVLGDSAAAGPLLRAARSDSFAAAGAAAAALGLVDPRALAASAGTGGHLREAADHLALRARAA